jgi:hypothetical protein
MRDRNRARIRHRRPTEQDDAPSARETVAGVVIVCDGDKHNEKHQFERMDERACGEGFLLLLINVNKVH